MPNGPSALRLDRERLERLVDEVNAQSAARRVRVAVLAPCYNEAATIGGVVSGFRAALPEATVYVYDNNSTDRTAEVARAAGAVVRRAPLRGKGNVVRRMFADVDADIYLLVDGDDTYDAGAARWMIDKLLDEGLDMVCGVRVTDEDAAYRAGHRTGNRVLNGLVHRIFGSDFADMLTGYRVMTRRFVKSFPAHSSGFETETELSVHALQMRLPVGEVETVYRARPEGSHSKLNTWGDGLRILGLIGLLVREERPLLFFSAIAGAFMLAALGLGAPVVLDYLRLEAVPRFPTLIVAVGMAMMGMLSFACGVILDSVSRARLEQRQLAYLAMPAPDVAP